MSTPTAQQVHVTLGRIVELCDPRHLEGHGPMAWPCNLPLAVKRADDYAGVLRSPGSSEGGRSSAVSNPTLQQALTALSAPTRRPNDGDVRPPAYDCDQRLHDATVAVAADCWWLLRGATPINPSIRPATLAFMCRAVDDRVGAYRMSEYTAIVVHVQELVHQILELCQTDRSQIGRRNTMADCQACSRPVAGTAKDPLRNGYCDACRKAWERSGRGDRALFERDRPKHSTDVEVVHIDPKQHGMVIA